MSFLEAVRVCLSKYVDFSGRAGRPEFWWFFLFNVLVSLVSSVLDSALGTDARPGAGLIQAFAGLALLLPGLAVGARRLHDISRSGWMQLLLLIPCLGFLLLAFWWADQGGGDNRYGPALKGTFPPVA
jgi:uncharacterized membrane protein YhaH (DUF805 family)